jgi:hypothetical protein
MPEYAGFGVDGPRYRLAIEALSDEVLIDRLPSSQSKGMAGMTADRLMTSLVAHARAGSMITQTNSLNAPVSLFIPDPGAAWSKSAGQIASQARAAYRVSEGILDVSQIPVAVHLLNEDDGSLDLANLTLTSSGRCAVANDITVCGEHEPVAFVTEYFVGDGSATEFRLSAEPFSPSTSLAAVVREAFDKTDIDRSVWSLSGGAGYLSLGGGGLTMNGGNGVDGQTQLAWTDSIELGGTFLLEAIGITLSAGSTGILAGFFAGLNTLPDCLAGFLSSAEPGTGSIAIQPIIGGAANGLTCPINPQNHYTLRIRIYCPEWERNLAVYRSYGANGAIAIGGQANPASARLLFEVQEFVNGVAGMPVILYDGAIEDLPQTCSLVAASSLNLVGTMRAVYLTNLGPNWVTSTPVGGNSYTRRLGSVVDAGECYLDRSGRLTFYGGFVPAAGERIAVSYRTVGRSIGRAVSADSQLLLAKDGSPAVSSWIGTVSSPPTRSSADCRHAAIAMVESASSVDALWKGTYRGVRPNFASDVWPGDALFINAQSANLSSQVVIRSVTITYAASYPDLFVYDISFANDWADDLAIRTSQTVPADAWLPVAIASTVLPDLNALTVVALDGIRVTINTGAAAPPAGGFEVRRRDFAFMAGEDPDLVARSTQQTITFSRESFNDRFYVRMYDGATPPNYSEHSAAVFINLPLGS